MKSQHKDPELQHDYEDIDPESVWNVFHNYIENTLIETKVHL